MEIKKFTRWENLLWTILPGRCVLCGKWKLWGKNPHKACEDYELRDSAESVVWQIPVNISHHDQLRLCANLAFKAGQTDQAALDQLNFDKERAEFWNMIADSRKQGKRPE